jgi:hypothetical protein
MRVRVDYEVCGVCVSVSVCVCVLEKESCLCVFEGRECNSMKDSERVYVYKKLRVLEQHIAVWHNEISVCVYVCRVSVRV